MPCPVDMVNFGIATRIGKRWKKDMLKIDRKLGNVASVKQNMV
jgi:hypothetical protein